jgi:hypothetical protein
MAFVRDYVPVVFDDLADLAVGERRWCIGD